VTWHSSYIYYAVHRHTFLPPNPPNPILIPFIIIEPFFVHSQQLSSSTVSYSWSLSISRSSDPSKSLLRNIHKKHLNTTQNFCYASRILLSSRSMSPASTLGVPTSPTRARSVSQPIREGVAADFSNMMPSLESSQMKPARSAYMRSHSSSAVQRTSPSTSHATLQQTPVSKGRARSSSLMTVTEVGGDEPENVVDRMGVGTNENANWVNAPGESR
jgi:hypothetical protein